MVKIKYFLIFLYNLYVSTFKYDIEKLNQIANTRGGVCLSTSYNGCVTKLVWQCSKRHTWESKPTNIIQGKWCPTCAILKHRKLDWSKTFLTRNIQEFIDGYLLEDGFLCFDKSSKTATLRINHKHLEITEFIANLFQRKIFPHLPNIITLIYFFSLFLLIIQMK